MSSVPQTDVAPPSPLLRKSAVAAIIAPHHFRRGVRALAAALTIWVLGSAGSLGASEPPGVVFEAPVAFETGESGPRDLERADFNNDGFLDVAILTTIGGGKIHFLLGGAGGGLSKDNTLLVSYASGIG